MASKVLTAVLFSYSSSLVAITITPAIQVGEYYTDNVFLTQPKQSDRITQIIPSVSLLDRTGKSTLEANYQLQVLRSQKQSAQDRTYHQGSVLFDTKQDNLGLELAGIYTQDITNPIGGITPNNLIGQNRPDVFTGSVMPKAGFRLGHLSNVDLTYRYGQVNYYSGANVAPTQDQRATANFVSGAMFDDVTWTWNSSDQQSRQNSTVNSKIQQTQFTTFTKVTSKIRAIFSAGYEDDEGRTLQTLKGGNWSVGGQWVPSRYTSVEAQIGHRPFGTTYVLDASWKRRSSELSVQYHDAITTDAQARLESIPQSISPLSSNSLARFFPQVTSLLFVNRTLQANWTYHYEKSSFVLGAFKEKRDYLQLPLHEDGKGYNLSWLYQINKQLQSELGYGSARQVFINGQSNPWWQSSAALNWLIGPHLNMQLKGEHFNSKPSGFPTITENSIFLNFVFKA